MGDGRRGKTRFMGRRNPGRENQTSSPKGEGAAGYSGAGRVLDPTIPVLALDPGVTTGACLWFVEYGYQIHQLEVSHVWNHLDNFLLAFGSASRIVYEDFTYRANQRHADLTPVKVIGVIEEWARQNGFILEHPQKPSQAKFFFTDSMLKKRGLYDNTVGKEHGRDALRHCLYYRKDYA